MSCNPEDLVADSLLLQGQPTKLLHAITLRILCAIRDQEELDCDDIEGLIDDATCLMCLTDAQMAAAMVILLCNVGNTITTGGGAAACITSGAGAPVDAPSDPTRTCIYVDTTGPDYSIWRWIPGGTGWV